MKNIFRILVVTMLVALSFSCKKDEISPEDVEVEGYSFMVNEDGKYVYANEEIRVMEASSEKLFVTFEKHPGVFVAQSFYDIEFKFTKNANDAIAGVNAIHYGSSAAIEVRGNSVGETGFTVEVFSKSDGTLLLRQSFAVRVTEHIEPDVYEAVDLGLSVKWATRNIGAASPEDKGFFVAWGETKPKTKYDWKKPGDYAWGVPDEDGEIYQTCGMTKYTSNVKYGDGLDTLQPGDDAATVNWGSKWRTPTIQELSELDDPTNCKWTWDNKRRGYVVESLKNGNSIFLPAAGFHDEYGFRGEGEYGEYWSSSVSDVIPTSALYLTFSPTEHSTYNNQRNVGHNVRAVTE